MEKYSSFQFTWLLLFIFLPIMGLIYYLYEYQLGSKPIPFLPMIIIEGVFVFIYLLFYGMRIKIKDQTLIISFGIGLIKKRIDLTILESVKKVRNPWYHYAVGIKLLPNGIFYGVHGLTALELAFKNKKRIIRIGTNDEDNLKYALDKFLK